jgi:hypothetical protein
MHADRRMPGRHSSFGEGFAVPCVPYHLLHVFSRTLNCNIHLCPCLSALASKLNADGALHHQASWTFQMEPTSSVTSDGTDG